MATYKVIQDIEAEDKFLGPMTLKQFIFGAIGIIFGWLSFFATTKGAPWAIIIFGPPMLLGFFLAFPWSKDQPTEVWVLAKLRFKLKPKKRIWNQDGIQELVTITAPKKIEKHLTNDLSQTEVKSRLKALADTIDTRGWAIKNANLDNALIEPVISDRLVDPVTLPEEVPIIDLASVNDMLDDHNPASANLDHMIQESTDARKQQNLSNLNRLRDGEPLENLSRPTVQFTPPTENTMRPVEVAKISPAEEEALTEHLSTTKSSGDIVYGHMHAIGRHKKHKKSTHKQKAQAPTQPAPTPAIMDLANNDDLNVATIARTAKKETDKRNDTEVVVPLR